MRSGVGAVRAILLWGMWILAGGYVLVLGIHAAGAGPSWEGWFGSFADDWLGLLTVWAPAAVCWLAASSARLRRPDVLLAAAAVTAYAAGDTVYLVTSIGGGVVPFPSLADVGYLLVYPLLLAALVVTVRRHARGLTLWVWLDCAVGSLGAAAVLAVVMQPVLESAGEGLSPLATLAATGPPVFDLVLVAFIAGIASLRGVEMGVRWTMLASGLLIFAATDVVYGLQVASGTYVLGTPVDAGWAVGLALMATWVELASRSKRAPGLATHDASRTAAMAVSSVATVAGLGVLVASSQVAVSPLALSLAAGALIAAGARAQLTNRLLERMAEQRLVAAATDELTGLPNRRAFYAEGHSRLLDPGKPRQALLMLDLDRFKEVNDSLGHRAGDLLLAEVSARLRDTLHGDDALARLGGDEFAILLDNAGREEALHAAERLSTAVAEPVTVDGASLSVGVSIGIAFFPDDGTDLSQLLRKSDLAMYKAKTSQRGYHVFSPADDADATATLQTIQELRSALETDQFELHYQPKVDLDSGQVHSVEALVRWQHPARGLLYPGAFLSLVEAAGLMHSLTLTVLGQALEQVAEWRRQGQPLTVAVNISASSLSDSDLPNQVATLLAAKGVPADALQLEITEEFLVGDRDLARAILTKLHTSGIKISVDDFGTGYSSLSYLRDLPIDEIKLDNSFVIPMTGDVRTTALVSSTIELAHNLGMRIVAEGVETAGTYTELSRMGCDQAQGYYMSRPVPAAELLRWLTHWQALDDPAEMPQRISVTA
ncbi:MAG TPA: EAL domain-containing protein [Propionicimonas sp.]|uniref:putative bifunctional diguanylate cyclase/phosphodiesterase n=1 Tax=Propionicimonas sp. TaxID=1955623 RepID=UPI002F3E20E3